MHKFILFLIITVTPIIHGSASSSDFAGASTDTSTDQTGASTVEISSLHDSALEKLVAHPRILAQNFQQFAALYPFQQQMLFTESLHLALRKRLGLKALCKSPHAPLIEYAFNDTNNCLIFSPDGGLFTSREENILHLYNAKTRHLIATFGTGWHPTFSPDGTILILEGATFVIDIERSLQVHNALTGELIDSFEGEHKPTFSPDSSLFASTTHDNAILIRNAKTGQLIHRFEREWQPTFSPDGTILASRSDSFTGYEYIYLRDTSTGNHIASLQNEWNPQFSPDGKFVVLTTENNAHQRLTQLRNAKTGQLIGSFHAEINPIFSPDGSILATRTGNDIRLRKPLTGELIGEIKNAQNAIFNRASTLFASLEYRERNQSDRTVNDQFDTSVYNLTTGQLIVSFHGAAGPTFTPDGSIFFFTRLNPRTNVDDMHLYNIATGKTICTLEGAWGSVFHPDGTILASTGLSREICLLNAATAQVLRSFKGELYPKFSPDGAILTADSDAGGIVLREVDFRSDMVTVLDPNEQRLLLDAAQDWLENNAYKVDPHNETYQNLIKRIAYLHDPLLFDTQTNLQDQSIQQQPTSSSSHLQFEKD